MIRFEDFKNNIEVTDKLDGNHVHVNKNVIHNSARETFTCKTALETKHQPLAAAILGLNNTDIPLPENVDFHNCWTDMDAQEAYLKQKPKTFLILGKQGTGCYSLGESLAKRINCIHLCPQNVLVDEIDQKSTTGKCLDFNMRHNNVCKFNTVLKIMKEKLKSPAIEHRGFVISGLPLVTSSKDAKYLINSLKGEESISIVENIVSDLINNIKKNKLKKRESSFSSISSENSEVPDEAEVEEEEVEVEPEIQLEEIEEQIVELPKFLLKSCSNTVHQSKVYYSTKKSVLLLQLHELFDLKPDIVIYITCPNADAVTKRNRKFFNYMNNITTFSPFESNTDNDIRWPTSYNIMSEYKKLDSHIFNPKYNCAQPIHLNKNATDQICNYKNIVTSFIEEKLKEYDPHYVIKLDGRTTIHHMINHTMELLQLMPIKPVLIPEPLYLEEPINDMEEFWIKIEELNVIRSGVMNFKRYSSPWYNRCPVQLKNRQSLCGNSKFAVTFFRHIYLLSSLDAMVSFCRNPRPFLKLEYLEPTCRIVIVGTRSSGKTMVAKCLSWIFDTPIICYKTILKNEKLKKYNYYSKTILSEIIANIEDTRFSQWQSKELERISNLNTWFNTVSSTLSSYVKVLAEKLDDDSKVEDVIFLDKYNSLRSQLSFLPQDDLQACQDALIDKNLLKYAPACLTTETNKPSTPVLGDSDVTDAISAYITAYDLQREIEPTTEELMTEIINIIQTNSEPNLKEQKFSKFIIDGFPSDPEYWDYLIESNLLPDYTVALFENREVDADLIQRYLDIETCVKIYEERYLLANDVLVKTKLLQGNPENLPLVDVQNIIEEAIKKSFDSISMYEGAAKIDLDLSKFTENIEKFREDWDNIKLKLEVNFKLCIEVELESKSDIQVLDEVLLKLRKGYCKPCLSNEEEPENHEDEIEQSKDELTYNDYRVLGEVSIYCPITFYDYGVLWKGKTEFTATYDNKLYYFSNEECRESLQYDITKYLSYNKPFKNIPPLRICIIGTIGSGKTSVAKTIAKELGLLHVDFVEYLNNFLIPKHFKKVGWQYENSFTDTLTDDEGVVEFQTDEENLNIFSDLLSNEQELRRLVSNYFERGAPLLPVLMQKLIRKLWFEDPFKTTGIVIDGYPKLPTDVEDMINCYCIPDVIIELEGSSETSLNRLSHIKLKTWKLQLNDAKNKVKNKLETEKAEWQEFVTKSIVIKLIIDEILENIVPGADNAIDNLSSQMSTIIDADPSGSPNIDVNLFTSYNEFIQEHPEPVDRSEWEKPEDVLEKINNRLESIFEIDDENIQNLKEIAEEQKISVIAIDAKKPLHKVVRRTLSSLQTYRNRSESFFEQTFVINCDIAEMLLSEGFFLLSKFYRMCPVSVMENPHTLFNSYSIGKRKNEIFPVIHRAYIYFISSEENVKKFRSNPLKYANNDAIKSLKRYTLRIGVIGPPKSGKSKLASKLAKKYGLICISKGMAIRHILEHMNWTVLGMKMKTLLHKGEVIDSELVMKAVITVALHHRTITNGFVLDGFPETLHEAHELAANGLFPLIMFDLKTNREKLLRNTQNEIHYNILKTKPPYPCTLIEYRYTNWYEKCLPVRDMIKEDTQNLYIINGNNSEWQCLVDACMNIDYIMQKIHYYLSHCKTEIVPVDVMCISKEQFQKRMSCYRNLCPVCFHKNILCHSGFPPFNKGLVQYKDYFYWICKEHYNLVLQHPHIFLCSKKIVIPEIPAVVKSVNPSLVYENGICIVTYAENLPSQKTLRGKNEFAAAYKKHTYLFCSPECLHKFLLKPHLYYNIKVFKEMSIFPKLSLKNLPHLGYLEQTVGNLITEACCSVNVLRPKYPGLSTRLSALIYIALYLKTHNSNMNKSVVSRYTKIFKVYEARCKLMIDIGQRLRSMDNPFAKYPMCCGKTSKPKQILSGSLRKPSTSNSSFYFESDFTRLA